MRKSRAYLAIIASVNLRMPTIHSFWMLNLSTGYSKPSNQGIFVRKSLFYFCYMTSKYCHVTENVHVFFVTPEKWSTRKRSHSTLDESHCKGINGFPQARDIQTEKGGMDFSLFAESIPSVVRRLSQEMSEVSSIRKSEWFWNKRSTEM